MVWLVFFGMVALTALAVKVYHTRYPYFSAVSQQDLQSRVPLPVVSSDASLDQIWQALFRSGSAAVRLERPDGALSGIITLDDALQDGEWTVNPKLKEAISD